MTGRRIGRRIGVAILLALLGTNLLTAVAGGGNPFPVATAMVGGFSLACFWRAERAERSR